MPVVESHVEEDYPPEKWVQSFYPVSSSFAFVLEDVC